MNHLPYSRLTFASAVAQALADDRPQTELDIMMKTKLSFNRHLAITSTNPTVAYGNDMQPFAYLLILSALEVKKYGLDSCRCLAL